MMTNHKLSKKIYTIILTAVLVYGAFFSVVAEIAFAEALAQDAEKKIEDTTEPKDSVKPTSDTPSSVGDTSEKDSAVEKKDNPSENNDVAKGGDNGEGIGDDDPEVTPDGTLPDDSGKQTEELSGDKKAGQTGGDPATGSEEEPVVPPADGDQNGDNNDNKDGDSDDHKILPEDELNKDEPKPAGTDKVKEEPIKDIDLQDERTYVNYTEHKDLNGTVRYKNFFYIFDEGAYGTEWMTIVLSYEYKHMQVEWSFRIAHHHDGSWEGRLPWGVYIDNNDLIIRGWMLVPGTTVRVEDTSMISGIHSDPDGSYDEPEYEPPIPAPVKRAEKTDSQNVQNVKKDNGVRSAVESPVIPPAATTDGPVPVVEKAYANEATLNETIEADADIINSVLSSYQSVSDSAVMDETNDNESPINATTAMLAGVAAMFLITMALVIVPKV